MENQDTSVEHYLYSPSTNSFYLRSIHGDAIPEDAVGVSPERRDELLNKQTAPDEDGQPQEVTETAEQLRPVILQYIDSWRDQEEVKGIVFDFDGRRYDGDDRSLGRLQGAIAGGLGNVDGFFWTTADNEDVQMGAEELTALLTRMHTERAIQGFKIHQRQRQMKEDIASLGIEALRAYQIRWPEPSAEITDPDQPA